MPAEAALSAAASAISSSSTATAVAKRPGFLATAGLIYRQDGAAGFTRGIQVAVARILIWLLDISVTILHAQNWTS
jgi:hypothetical protein